MCLAIVKPKGVQISRKYLENGYDGNPHGCGFAYVKGQRIVVEKGFKDFGAFYQAIKPVMSKHHMLIHFRWATHGGKTVDNTHPFLINDGQFAVIHNGCLNIKVSGGKSDTRVFCEDVLQPMFRRVRFDDEALKFLIEGNITASNKIAVMRADGKVVIFNERIGHWHKGAWYSNKGYETIKWKPSDYVTTASAKGSVEQMWSRLGYSGQPKQGSAWPTWKPETDVVTEPDPDEIAAEAAAAMDAEAAKESFPDHEGRAYEQPETGTL